MIRLSHNNKLAVRWFALTVIGLSLSLSGLCMARTDFEIDRDQTTASFEKIRQETIGKKRDPSKKQDDLLNMFAARYANTEHAAESLMHGLRLRNRAGGLGAYQYLASARNKLIAGYGDQPGVLMFLHDELGVFMHREQGFNAILTTGDGAKIRMPMDLLGQKAIVVFWASDAPAIKDGIAELNKELASLQDDGFKIIGINLDGSREAAQAFIDANRLDWTHTFADKGRDDPAYRIYGSTKLPCFIIIRPNGAIADYRLRAAGPMRGVANDIDGAKHLISGAFLGDAPDELKKAFAELREKVRGSADRMANRTAVLWLAQRFADRETAELAKAGAVVLAAGCGEAGLTHGLSNESAVDIRVRRAYRFLGFTPDTGRVFKGKFKMLPDGGSREFPASLTKRLTLVFVTKLPEDPEQKRERLGLLRKHRREFKQYQSNMETIALFAEVDNLKELLKQEDISGPMASISSGQYAKLQDEHGIRGNSTHILILAEDGTVIHSLPRFGQGEHGVFENLRAVLGRITFDVAYDAIERKEFAVGSELLSMAIRFGENSKPIYHLRAHAYVQQGEWGKALKDMNRTVQGTQHAYFGNAHYYMYRSLVLRGLGRTEEAKAIALTAQGYASEAQGRDPTAPRTVKAGQWTIVGPFVKGGGQFQADKNKEERPSWARQLPKINSVAGLFKGADGTRQAVEVLTIPMGTTVDLGKIWQPGNKPCVAYAFMDLGTREGLSMPVEIGPGGPVKFIRGSSIMYQSGASLAKRTGNVNIDSMNGTFAVELSSIGDYWIFSGRVIERKYPSKVVVKQKQWIGTAVNKWMVIGPFHNQGGAEVDVAHVIENEPIDLANTYKGRGEKDVKWVLQDIKSMLAFRDDCVVDFNKLYGWPENVAAYAVTWVDAPKDMNAKFGIGSEDGFVIWVNDKRIGELHEKERGYRINDHVKSFKLKKGANKILVKISVTHGGWKFGANIMSTEGKKIEGLKYRLKP